MKPLSTPSEPTPAERLRDFLADPECHVAGDIPDDIWIPFCESLRTPVSERGTLSAVKQFVRGWMHECPTDTPTVKRLCELNALFERSEGSK